MQLQLQRLAARRLLSIPHLLVVEGVGDVQSGWLVSLHA
jgi:hypothetical protein